MDGRARALIQTGAPVRACIHAIDPSVEKRKENEEWREILTFPQGALKQMMGLNAGDTVLDQLDQSDLVSLGSGRLISLGRDLVVTFPTKR